MQCIRAEGKPIAIGAEGINLRADGRMTLLKLCTWDGQVYLLDLMDPDFPDDPKFGQKLLENGGVKDLLLSSDVEKVRLKNMGIILTNQGPELCGAVVAQDLGRSR